jgi:hypothetical protein
MPDPFSAVASSIGDSVHSEEIHYFFDACDQ